MPVKLNLLPPELAVSKNLRQLLKVLRAMGVIGVALFLVFGMGVGIFIITSTVKLNNIDSNITQLKAQVSSQQKSEQLVILLKDRIAKTALVQKMPSSSENLKTVEPFLAGLSAGTLINQMAVSPTSTVLSVNLKTNSDLASFLNSFQASDVFKSVNLTSFSLSPITGYSLEVVAVKK
jgi:cell division protein FtsL